MKVTYNWIKQYVDIKWSPEEVAQKLTMLGMEVEALQKIGGQFDKIVVAQVISCQKHPNADKLQLCKVFDGESERQIVCGAWNFKPGDKVPLALPGAELPSKPGEKPVTIKVGKIRGVESFGMMCSAEELGISEDASGIMILNPEAQVGQPFSNYLGLGETDFVYDLEITPNRPDLNSVIGIARELSALSGEHFKLPQVKEQSDLNLLASEQIDHLVDVAINDIDLCPRYIARLVKGVKVGPSPAWLKTILEKTGFRSINNIVDVTNYVMLETGQPLHAFDYNLISKAPDNKHRIIVRRAMNDEKFITLDDKEHVLNEQMLLIADTAKGIALAGIMGGKNSEIMDSTTDVLLESAYFKPQNIRMTSKKLGIRSDASYRFERGVDIQMCDWASRRAVQLILNLAGGTPVAGVIDQYPQKLEQRKVTLRFQRTNSLLGLDIPGEIQRKILIDLQFKPEPAAEVNEKSITVCVPSWRHDIKREADLIEEVGRFFGVEKIPSQIKLSTVGKHTFDPIRDEYTQIINILTGLGLFEIQGQTLISENAAFPEYPYKPVKLLNPISSDMNILRPSLLPGLLAVLKHNASRKANEIKIFEIGRVFGQAESGPFEKWQLALSMTGMRNKLFWEGQERSAKLDIFDLKGVIEEFFDYWGIKGVQYVRKAKPDSFFVESAAVQLGKICLGVLGQVQPMIVKQYDIKDPVFMAELDIDLLRTRRIPNVSFKPLPAHPAIRRDLAMIVPEDTTHEMIIQAVKKCKPPILESIELFDIYRGANVPSGFKSMAYCFIYRHDEKTLTDDEVNVNHQKIMETLKSSLNVVIREA